MYLLRAKNIYLAMGVTTLIIIITTKYSAGEFTIIPSAEALPVGIGEETVFRCQNIGARFVFWNFNGSMVTQDPPPDITPATTRDENDRLVNTLTIVARLEFNGTRVECGAILQNGSTILTPSVELLIAGNSSATTYSNSAILVRVTPNHPVLTVASGETVILRCHRPNATIGWSVNETTLGSSTFNELIFNLTSHSFLNGSQVYLLIFTVNESYSGISIKCIAFINIVGRNPDSEETSSIGIIVQGILDGVNNISRTSNSNLISWYPPTSANLTNVEPDIAYCLEVYNTTCWSGNLLISLCNLMESHYIYDDDELHPHCTYNFTVTPRSNIEGASNGSTATKEEFFRFWDELPKNIIQHQNRSNLVHVEIHLDSKFKGDVEPEWYSLLMHPIDNVEREHSLIRLRKNTSHRGMVLSTIQPLPVNRLWRSSVISSHCLNNPVTRTFIISTHELQNITVSSPLPGEIKISGCFTRGSNAVGALMIVYSSRGVHYSFSTPPNQCVIVAKVSGLERGHYQVSIFVVEEGGLPFNRSAIVPQNITIDQGGTEQEETVIEYELSSTATGVCVCCTFLESTLTECVVVVHQRISQLSPPGLINIESSHSFHRSGNTAYGCIDGLMTNSTDYSISVLGGNFTTQIQGKSKSGYIIAGVVLTTVLGVLVITISAIIICYIKYRRSKKKSVQPYVVMASSESAAAVELHDAVVCGSNKVYTKYPTSPCAPSISEESSRLLQILPTSPTLGAGSHYLATPTKPLLESTNPREHDHDYYESEDTGGGKQDLGVMEKPTVSPSFSGTRNSPSDIDKTKIQDHDPKASVTVERNENKDAAGTLIQGSDKLEQGDATNIEKVPVSKSECPEAKVDMAFPESSGKKSEPIPISRRDMQHCHSQTCRATTDEFTPNPKVPGVWQQKCTITQVEPGYPTLVSDNNIMEDSSSKEDGTDNIEDTGVIEDHKEECDLDRQPQPNEMVDKEMIVDPISDPVQIANPLQDGCSGQVCDNSTKVEDENDEDEDHERFMEAKTVTRDQ